VKRTETEQQGSCSRLGSGTTASAASSSSSAAQPSGRPREPRDSSLPHHALQPGVDEGEASEGRLVHGVDEVLVGVGEAGFLVQELPVKVAAVAGGLLPGVGGVGVLPWR